MNIFTITEIEQVQIRELLEGMNEKYKSADSEDFLCNAYMYAAELPITIQSQMYNLKNSENHSGCLIIRGVKTDSALPSTPASWGPEDTYTPNLKTDYLGVILTSLIGEAFGFHTQQSGKLIHDVVPIKGREYYQAGCSSLAKLNFHTEDAFHPCRGEFICFHCLRNPDNVGTLGASVNMLDIPLEIKNILFEPRFYTVPDNSHSMDSAKQEMHSILFGNRDHFYIRIDPDFTYAKEDDEEAAKAIKFIIEEIESKLIEIPMQTGDYVFIDNFKWLHGRKPFVANYDGNDRWLKRLNITVDLRKSAEYRDCNSSRLLHAMPVSGSY